MAALNTSFTSRQLKCHCCGLYDIKSGLAAAFLLFIMHPFSSKCNPKSKIL